jgi:acyl-CoA synthetase (AMP-forming)/AMP-acid ligase II
MSDSQRTAVSTVLPVSERRAAVAAAYGPVWQPVAFDEFFERKAISLEAAPMLITKDRTWTYGDVLRESQCVAAWLHDHGVRPGDRVALVMANHPVFASLLIGAWRIGASVIPPSTSCSRQESWGTSSRSLVVRLSSQWTDSAPKITKPCSTA